MKALVLSLAAVVGLASTSFGQARAGDVKIEKISPSVVKTPQFALQGGGTIKRSKDLDWLEVEVEFQTAPEIIEELSFNYKIQINGQLLVGQVDHVDIPKGRDHFSVAYIAPRVLDKVMNGKNLTSAAVQGIWVDATKQGQVISTLSTTKTAVPNLPQVTGKVLNKSQTPFAPLWYDRYEALKATPR
ncbi:MAG TPA: Amuc_1102 family pilus-like protein [Chthoniobacteraceae bacterium]|jgi:hypothetical protein|nr:Amuc_1102 family pilus-like protein [Chthoniobacteraceae bacterium]